MSVFNTTKYLHQVLIVDGYQIPNILPSMMVENTKYAKIHYPEADYKLWSGEDLRDFIRADIGSDALHAFDTLAPYSYKCDFARYCLMYVFGGIYFDLAIRFVNKWEVPTRFGIAAFSEMYQGMESWTCTQTSLLWSKPGRPEWKFAIDVIIRNCETRFYGPHDHYPTAGALLGRSFAAAMALKGQSNAADDQFMGEVRYITPERRPQNVSYVSPDRVLVALRTKLVSGDLTEMGLSGTNNYLFMWRAKKAYGERDHVWRYDDTSLYVESRASRTSTGITVQKGTRGRIIYGPFVNLSAGVYNLSFRFSDETTFSKLFIDVYTSDGATLIHELMIDDANERRHDLVEFDIVLDRSYDDVEFRVSVFEDFVGELRTITLKDTDRLVFGASDSRIQLIGVSRTLSGIRIPSGSNGRVMFGPYVELEPGLYQMMVKFGNATRLDDLNIEICANAGNKILRRYRPTSTRKASTDVRFEFEIEHTTPDVEFRIAVGPAFDGEFKAFVIHPVKLTGELMNDDDLEATRAEPLIKRRHLPATIAKVRSLLR